MQRHRESDLQYSAQLVANAPVLKAVMATQDPLTIQDASQSIWQMSGASLLVLANPACEVMAVHVTGPGLEARTAQSLFLANSVPSGGAASPGWWFAEGLMKSPCSRLFSEIADVDGRVNEIGKLEAHVHYTFRGDEELMLRSIFRRLPEAQWQRVVENVNVGMGGEITHLKISDPAATREAFTMSYDVAKPNFLDWSKKKSDLVLPLCQFNLPDIGNGDDDGDPGHEPLKLGPKAEYENEHEP